MKNSLAGLSVFAALCVVSWRSSATVYSDATGDNYGAAEVDISSVVLTNDANNLLFTIRLNSAATISASPNYLVGIQVSGGDIGQTNINNAGSGVNAGNPWGKRVGISTGENYFIGCYPNGSGYSGGAQLYHYTNGVGWSPQIGATASLTEVASGTPSLTFSFPLSTLGLNPGDSFKFDVWTSYGSPGGQGAYDALDSSTQAASAPYGPTFATYDSATAAGSSLATYTVASAAAAETHVTFQVNMAAAMVQGLFAPDLGDYVEARGSFNAWLAGVHTGILLTNVPGTSNYVGTLDTNTLSLGTSVDYKYVIDSGAAGNDWEGNVGPNGTANRNFVLTNINQALPLDSWNNITNPYVSYPVGFQVNMTVPNAYGTFTPGVDTIYVNGDWDWSGSALALTQTANPNIYTGTVALAFSPGTVVKYKYAMDGGVPVNSWESIADRTFTLNGATNLPADFFNNVNNLGSLSISNDPSGPTLSWTVGTNIRLQSSTNLPSTWSDVPNSQGQTSASFPPLPGQMFFRLTGP